MYIQPPGDDPIAIPRNYSGNAFRQIPREAPPPEAAAEQPPSEPTPPVAEAVQAPEAAEAPPPLEAPSAPAGAFGEGKEKGRGIRDRFPFLSSLLPPHRGEHKKGGILPEWALIGAVILLFLWEDEENDILPFLLLLLLWD